MDEQAQPGIQQLIKALPLEERLPVVALKALYDQRQTLDQEQETQLEVVRKKYADRVKPLLQRVAELVAGSAPRQEEVAALGQYLKAGEKPAQLKGKIIDGYWSGVLQNSQLESVISEKDSQALENLLNVTFAGEEPNSICLKFLFKPNPYFAQTTVVRKLRKSEGQAVCLEGNLLTPKPGYWLTHESKNVTNKSNGQTKQIQGKKVQSFFDIFLNWTAVDNPTELHRCSEIMQELSLVIRDSLNFFLGVYEIDEESEEDLEGYEDEDEEEESSHNKKRKK